MILDGKVHGQRIDIQPTSAPSLVVSVANIAARSVAHRRRGRHGRQPRSSATLLDLSQVETQTLARYTNDAGNHVLVEVHPAATLAIR